MSIAAVGLLEAQDASFWSFLPRERAIERCGARTQAATSAAAALNRFSDRLEQLRDLDPHRPVVQELHRMLREPCFLAAAEDDRLPRPDSSASLKEWWREGGWQWLHSYLELPRYGDSDRLVPHVVLPPDARPTLSAETAWNPALAAVICRSGAACGGRTRGWRDRAESAFEAHYQAGKHLSFAEREQPRDPGGIATRCGAGLSGSDPMTRYHGWRECLESSRPRRRAMPLGATRVPEQGWFILEGHRGHDDFCDGIAAYHLATGAALAVRRCSPLVPETGGAVDRAATHAARTETVTAGTLSVDNLREAVWMIALRTQVPELQVAAEFYPLPAGLAVVSGRRRQPDPEWLQSSVSSTAQTTLTWHWLLADRVPVSGGLLVGSFEAHEAHAEALLEIAEAGLVEGCIPARPPAGVTFGSNESEVLYQDALKKWARAHLCR